jgi:hypothetical protein
MRTPPKAQWRLGRQGWPARSAHDARAPYDPSKPTMTGLAWTSTPPQKRKVRGRRIQRPAANAVLTTALDTLGRSWTPRCPGRSSGLIRRTAMDSRGPGHSPEKRNASDSATVPARTMPALHKTRSTGYASCVAELGRTRSRRLRCAPPLARRQRRALALGGPARRTPGHPGARRR